MFNGTFSYISSMIKSMTGYGKAEAEIGSGKITVEIRSLNSKQLDLSVRMPAVYRPYEFEIRNLVSKSMARGKVDVFIALEAAACASAAEVNKDLFDLYYKKFSELADGMDRTENQGLNAAIFKAILRMPDVIASESGEVDEDEKNTLFCAVERALAAAGEFREQEGERLIQDILERIDNISACKNQVAPYEGRRTEAVKERIMDSLKQLNTAVDENRLEQEMIYYIEKLDITEEKVRLDNHCRYFREVAFGEDNPGRKLGFIAQEIGREINTMGSKANDSDIQRIVVQMKDELEKIKEQILNIL